MPPKSISKITYGRDALGPFVTVTIMLRDQDDRLNITWGDIPATDIERICEHLPRAINGRPAIRDHSGEDRPATGGGSGGGISSEGATLSGCAGGGGGGGAVSSGTSGKSF